MLTESLNKIKKFSGGSISLFSNDIQFHSSAEKDEEGIGSH